MILPCILVALSIGATACGGDRVSPAGATATGTAPVASAPAEPEPSEFTKPIGDTVTYASGSTVQVSNLQPYRPSSSAAGTGEGSRYLVVDVTIKNGNAEPFDTALLSVGATCDGAAASAIYDSAKNIMGFPQTQLQPGKTATGKAVFGVQQNCGELQVEVRPSFGSETAVFTSAL